MDGNHRSQRNDGFNRREMEQRGLHREMSINEAIEAIEKR
jgi:hypothetical protein